MAMRLKIQSRSGKDILKNGLEVPAEVGCDLGHIALVSLFRNESLQTFCILHSRAASLGCQGCILATGIKRWQPLSFSPAQGTVADLQRAFHSAKHQFYPSRQRFSLPVKAGEKKATALVHGKKLSDYDLTDGSVLIFKDLGPQVLLSSWTNALHANSHRWL